MDVLDKKCAVNFPVKGCEYFKEVSIGGYLANYVSMVVPRFKDIDILASKDIAAIDNVSIDLVYKVPKDELKDIKECIEKCKGLHQLEYWAEIGLGSRKYCSVEVK